MAQVFHETNGRAESADADVPSEVETFNPAAGPGQRRSKTHWKDVANTQPMPRIDPDVYSTKKSVAQGFMDVALLSANADQLRTLLKTGESGSPFYVVCVVFISLSLVVQVLIAVCLLVKTRYNINLPDQFRRSETLNNVVMIASVFLTVFNVLASSFMSEVPAMEDTEWFPSIPGVTSVFPRGGDGASVEPVIGSS